MSRLARAAAAITLAFLASSLRAGDEYAPLVPWRVVERGEKVSGAPLVLYWIPGTTEELRRSPMLTSEALTMFSERCVAMRVLRLDDHVRLAELRVGAPLPLVILVSGEGEVGRVEAVDGDLRVDDVEDLVHDELDRREEEAEVLLDRARELAQAGETDAALALYNAVWSARCVCPRQARDARRALRKLALK